MPTEIWRSQLQSEASEGEGRKEGRKEASKQASKEGSKQASKEGRKEKATLIRSQDPHQAGGKHKMKG